MVQKVKNLIKNFITLIDMPRPKSGEPKTIMCIQVSAETKERYYALLRRFQLLVTEGKIVLPWKRDRTAVTHDDFVRFLLQLAEEAMSSAGGSVLT